MLSNEKIRDLQQFELFKDLDFETLEQIVPYFTKRLYKRNEVVYATNTEARYFLFVLTGKVKIFRLSELGNEQIIRMIAPTEFTGELALFEGVRKAHAVAMVASEIYLIENQQFKQLLVDHPQLSLKMIEALSQRLHASEEQAVWLSTCTAKDRLFNFICKEAQIVNGHKIFCHEETKRFLAGFLGMTSETLSRSLHQLAEEGKIKEWQNHQIEVFC